MCLVRLGLSNTLPDMTELSTCHCIQNKYYDVIVYLITIQNIIKEKNSNDKLAFVYKFQFEVNINF